MNKIKELCNKYRISHRQLGILTGYNRQHIQKVNTGKRNMAPRFETLLDGIAKGLERGDIKIPD